MTNAAIPSAEHCESGTLRKERVVVPSSRAARSTSPRGRLPQTKLPMWLFDVESRAILEANDALERTLGYPTATLSRYDVDTLVARAADGGPLLTRRTRDGVHFESVVLRRNDGTTFEAEAAILEVGDARTERMVIVSAEEVAHAKTLLGRPRPLALLLEPLVSAHERARMSRVDRAAAMARGLAHEPLFMTLDPAAFVELDPGPLVQRVLDRVRERAATKRLRLSFTCTAVRVHLEPASFLEALYELVDNAVTASKLDGEVRIDVSRTSTGDVLWQVIDQGCGMSAAELGELGRPSSDALRSGSGLGVGLAWTVVDGHRGLLRFGSDVGCGTTASIWLPEAVA